MRILGIDPGSVVSGFGILEESHRDIHCLTQGTLSPAKDRDFFERLYEIHKGLKEVIREYAPQVVAVEKIFHAKNAASALKLGHARGVALLAAVEAKIPIYEYTPLEIKLSVVGYGRASKEQVQQMIRVILKLSSPVPEDASDALAAAICHFHTHKITHRLQELKK